MARPNIVELTDEQIVERNKDERFRKRYAETGVISSAYDGKYAILMAIAVNTQLTEGQMDTLQDLIEDITGVHKAFALLGPARIPVDKVEEGEELRIGVTGEFHIAQTSL